MAQRLEITASELTEALVRATRDTPKEARTVKEIMQLTKLSKEKVHQALGSLAMQDRIEVHYVRRKDLSGRMNDRPAYTILPPKGKK